MEDSRFKAVALSTVDNPYNPFTQFDSWYHYDEIQGYHSCALLDRFAHTSNELSEAEYIEEIDSAIDRILRIDPLGLYIKVVAK